MSINTLNKTTRQLEPLAGGGLYNAGAGLVKNGSEFSADLKDPTLSSLTSGARSSDGCEYPIGLDSNGNLSVNVPSGGKYATSDTAASTTAKVASTSNGDFTLQTGNSIKIKFTYENTATSPTLNVDDTGAKTIKGYGTTKPDIWWADGDVVEFVYDGTYWIMQPSQGQLSTINSALSAYKTPVHLGSNVGVISTSYDITNYDYIGIEFIDDKEGNKRCTGHAFAAKKQIIDMFTNRSCARYDIIGANSSGCGITAISNSSITVTCFNANNVVHVYGY